MAAHGRWLMYDPQPDITTWELAQVLYVLIHALTPGKEHATTRIFEEQPPEVKRHFEDLRTPKGN